MTHDHIPNVDKKNVQVEVVIVGQDLTHKLDRG